MNNQNTIVATNPGQFYYHQRGVNTFATTTSWEFRLSWPDKFSPQVAGGMPIHAYVQLAGSDERLDRLDAAVDQPLLERRAEPVRRRDCRRHDHRQQRPGRRHSLGECPPRLQPEGHNTVIDLHEGADHVRPLPVRRRSSRPSRAAQSSARAPRTRRSSVAARRSPSSTARPSIRPAPVSRTPGSSSSRARTRRRPRPTATATTSSTMARHAPPRTVSQAPAPARGPAGLAIAGGATVLTILGNGVAADAERHLPDRNHRHGGPPGERVAGDRASPTLPTHSISVSKGSAYNRNLKFRN